MPDPDTINPTEPCFRCGRMAENPVIACGQIAKNPKTYRMPLCLVCMGVLGKNPQRFFALLRRKYG